MNNNYSRNGQYGNMNRGPSRNGYGSYQNNNRQDFPQRSGNWHDNYQNPNQTGGYYNGQEFPPNNGNGQGDRFSGYPDRNGPGDFYRFGQNYPPPQGYEQPFYRDDFAPQYNGSPPNEGPYFWNGPDFPFQQPHYSQQDAHGQGPFRNEPRNYGPSRNEGPHYGNGQGSMHQPSQYRQQDAESNRQMQSRSDRGRGMNRGKNSQGRNRRNKRPAPRASPNPQNAANENMEYSASNNKRQKNMPFEPTKSETDSKVSLETEKSQEQQSGPAVRFPMAGSVSNRGTQRLSAMQMKNRGGVAALRNRRQDFRGPSPCRRQQASPFNPPFFICVD
ncbi:hypothetical protein EAF04_003741 [Stromatinia cepivora]|nr:hypothetical protein EAF04_003741 [Stromatinia cepivora]